MDIKPTYSSTMVSIKLTLQPKIIASPNPTALATSITDTMMTFTARRSEPVLLQPARPTPRETKSLSDLDDQRTLRYYETVVGFFRSCRDGAVARPADPGKAIRVALAEALVYYYPVAGRLREEVTRLKCGGFVLGFHICHTIADGFGMAQLIMAIAELARGEAAPTILPVWRRDILTARSLGAGPVTHTPSSSRSAHEPVLNSRHDASATAADAMVTTPPDRMVVEYFLFGPREVSTLRGKLPAHLAASTTAFELLTAVMWRCRTAALGYGPDQPVRLMITMNARGRWNAHTPLPLGYYGNAHVSPVLEAAAGELVGGPLADTVELVRRTKRGMTRDRMRAMVEKVSRLREWPPSTMDRVYEVSDIKWTAANVLKFGWAELAGGGIPLAGDLTSKLGSDHTRCRNAYGEVSTVVSMLLPRIAMARFKKEMAAWLNKDDEKSLTIISSL
ncbi:hypothetical protein ABZP36_011910 [Zizania latifolia]